MAKSEEEDRVQARRAETQRSNQLAIMLAAARVATEAGYTATTMRSIAKEAGYTASSLYTYFSSKEEIFERVRVETLARLVETLEEEVPEGLEFRARLAVLAHRLSRLVEEFRDVLALHILGSSELPGQDGAARLEKTTKVHALFAAWFEKNATPEDLGGHSATTAGFLLHGLQTMFMERALIEGAGKLDRDHLKACTSRAIAFFLAALTAPADP